MVELDFDYAYILSGSTSSKYNCSPLHGSPTIDASFAKHQEVERKQVVAKNLYNRG
jgi:hypothetical protein